MKAIMEECQELRKGKKRCLCRHYFPYRLYIREGGRGKQKFVAWGVTCIRCGVVYSKNPIRISPETRQYWEDIEKMQDEGKI
jgi:hypothetical protein